MKREKVYCKVLKADVYKDTKGCLDYTCLTCPDLIKESTPKQIPKPISITKKVKAQKTTGVKKKDNKKYLEESYRVMPSTLDEWIDEELNRCHKGNEGGNFGALKDVIRYCEEFRKPLPEWANKKLYEVINDQSSGNIKKKKGRYPTWIKQYKQDMIDFARADTIQDCIDHGIQWTYTTKKKNGEIIREATDVYSIVSDLLKDTFAEGNSDAIAKSYKRYKQRSKKEPYRYMILKTFRFKKDINLPLTPERLQVLKKIASLRKNK